MIYRKEKAGNQDLIGLLGKMPTRGEVGVVRDPSGMHVPERAISSTEGFDNCRRCHHGRLSKRFFIYAAFAESGGSVRRVG